MNAHCMCITKHYTGKVHVRIDLLNASMCVTRYSIITHSELHPTTGGVAIFDHTQINTENASKRIDLFPAKEIKACFKATGPVSDLVAQSGSICTIIATRSSQPTEMLMR